MESVRLLKPEETVEQRTWNQSAEGMLRRLLHNMEIRTVSPKEMIIVYVDNLEGHRHLVIESTQHDELKLAGLLTTAAKRQADLMLYGE